MPAVNDWVLNSVRKYEDVSRLAPVTAAIQRAMTVCKNFQDEARKIADDKNLSQEGRREKRDAFLKTNSPEIIRARKAAAAAIGRIRERRSKFKLPGIDRTDAATAAMHGQIRDRLFKMSAGERDAFLPTADPMFWQAALEAPNMLTGINDETRETLVSLSLEKTYPGQLAQIEHDREAAQLLKSASQILSEAVCEISNFPNVTVLDQILDENVMDQRHIDADVSRAMESLANAGVRTTPLPTPRVEKVVVAPPAEPEETEAEADARRLEWARGEIAKLNAL
jgi:hypothetical protein